MKSRDGLLEEVMQTHKQSQLDSIKSNLPLGDARVTATQHKIDSIAFSDIFKGSQQAKDSIFVADYNKMMAKTTPTLQRDEFSFKPNAEVADYKAFDKSLSEALTVKEMKNIKKNPVLPENGGKRYFHTGRQYLVDSVYHQKLFEKYDLLNDSTKKVFKKICNKVRP